MNQTIPILLLLALITMGCRGEVDSGDESLSLSLAISPTPPAVGTARLLISLHDSLDAPLADARIAVEGNMSHAGMIPVLDTALAGDPGSYTVPEFPFSMAGDWFIDVKAVLPDGRRTQRRFTAHVVGNPAGNSRELHPTAKETPSAPGGSHPGPGASGS